MTINFEPYIKNSYTPVAATAASLHTVGLAERIRAMREVARRYGSDMDIVMEVDPLLQEDEVGQVLDVNA